MSVRPKSGWWQGNCPADPWPVPKRVRKARALVELFRQAVENVARENDAKKEET